MWHEWNMNTGDVMVMWFTSYVNLVTSQQACILSTGMHGTHALSKMGAPKYLNSLMVTLANPNLRKLTASHFWVLITQNANEHMPNMFLTVHLNENLRYLLKNSSSPLS